MKQGISWRSWKIIFSLIFFSVLILENLPAYSQVHDGYLVKGKVIDLVSGLPLQAASVFAQNTTLGTATDAEGRFAIYLPEGGYDLAITYTGYESESRRVTKTAATEELLFTLAPKEKSLEAVSVTLTNEVKNGWEKYGEFFRENFIGQSVFSGQCIVENPGALHFYYSKKRDRLKVLSDTPLVINNYALGYKVHFALDSFINEYGTHTASFVGYPVFEEMKGDSAQMSLWQSNRSKAYKGSLLQLMRSIYEKRITENGFELQFIIANDGVEYPVKLLNLYGALHYAIDDSTGIVEINPAQRELAIIYNKEHPEAAYERTDSAAGKKNFQLSTITFAAGESIIIERNGYFYDQQDLITNGYMAFKKIGDMLPYNYDVEVVNPLPVIPGSNN